MNKIAVLEVILMTGISSVLIRILAIRRNCRLGQGVFSKSVFGLSNLKVFRYSVLCYWCRKNFEFVYIELELGLVCSIMVGGGENIFSNNTLQLYVPSICGNRNALEVRIGLFDKKLELDFHYQRICVFQDDEDIIPSLIRKQP